MTDKDPKDMTASELLRWAAAAEDRRDRCCESVLNEASGNGNGICLAPDACRHLADKIDAELAEAVRSTGKPMKAVRRIIAAGEDWPAPHEGEGFRKYIERCFLPRPRFADGEPVQFGDATDVGELIGVTFYGRNSGSRAGSVSLVTAENDAVSIDEGHRVERPAPEVLLADGKPAKVGETAYWVCDGTEVRIDGFDVLVNGERCIACGAARPLPSDLTHTPPALAADGKPLRRGDTVWLTDEGAVHAGQKWHEGDKDCGLYGIGPNDRLTVEHIDASGAVRLVEEAWCPASWLTHEEPDSRDAIAAAIGEKMASRIDAVVKRGGWLNG